ncbi:MAG: Na+/H+ antiporter subunit E [Marinomonas sp.]|uniref:Na+/H+ antiporter subunit E n=1 Tax=unclassified Marinomonas TaxID=196814 RepID=UPI0007AF8730|nr:MULTISPECIES: Na+/H+ antiporter subunit E [unclassified Marinomonas]KZM39322.1 cation:proton antiporter [Marinomonas sp. SBI22]KZM40131.1 cation:proton antiporter [Marinomonas sp. SBI8L]
MKQSSFRMFPMPFHSMLLFVIWLLLNNSLSAGHLLLATILAIIIPWAVSSMTTERPRIKKPMLAISYVFLVLKDIISANFSVALLVVGPLKKLSPGFVAVPLDIETELGITLLASTVSLTPGTVSAEISADQKWLYVHALHLENPEELIEEVKSRYEAPLKEIFGC